jgi:hypothetical protein
VIAPSPARVAGKMAIAPDLTMNEPTSNIRPENGDAT